MKIKSILAYSIGLSLLLINTPQINAQEESNTQTKINTSKNIKSFQLGLMTSANFSWVKATQKPLLSNGVGMGYSIGITGDFNLSSDKSNYFFTVEALSTVIRSKTALNKDENAFTMKRDGLSYTNVEHTYNINYIEIPLSLKLKLNEIGYTTWFGQIGIAPSIRYSSRAKMSAKDLSNATLNTEWYNTNSSRIEDTDFEFDEFRDDIRFLRFATVIGFGMEYRFSGSAALMAGLRLNNGLTNFISDNRDPKAGGNNNFVSLNVGVLF
jgi:hypothetical protein